MYKESRATVEIEQESVLIVQDWNSIYAIFNIDKKKSRSVNPKNKGSMKKIFDSNDITWLGTRSPCLETLEEGSPITIDPLTFIIFEQMT